ncbi:DUF1206 domain-containing protein [Pontibacter cellulosilyticus]|uniref:DUF1206 domain-containing protein n=1 Tax=Pontibacter cellulosilyticus TaxID=1720253 RepID=A0A923N2B9_9BACT|nr:DUF1206 domain-containing protein [Pontibacter cellulosilyticus]MBC5991590.1 DUF1206 domain-containing protein [Pontibacter cellulosilyticus]
MRDISAHVPSPPPKWVENFARVGLTAKGVVYCLVGILAFMAAFELGRNSSNGAGKQGVFQFILEQPFGKWLLGIVALGLACYAIWRLIQGVNDSENKGDDAKGIAKRLRYIFSGLVYAALAYLAAQMVLGNSGGSSGGGDSRETLAAQLLQQPFGQWLAGIVAIIIIGTGIYQIYYGLSDKYKKNVRGAGLKHEVEEKMVRMGKIGYVARGVVWILIGYMFLKAAMQSDPQEAGGSGQAFQFLESSSYGSYLLGAVAVGLVFYGIFMFMRAKYQPISTSS